MDGGTSLWEKTKWQNRLRAKKERTLWRTMVGDVLKGQCRYKNKKNVEEAVR